MPLGIAQLSSFLPRSAAAGVTPVTETPHTGGADRREAAGFRLPADAFVAASAPAIQGCQSPSAGAAR